MTKTETKPDNKTYPSAFYAAAGVGDLAYEQLRKLPELADQLRGKASELADRAATLREQTGAANPEVWKVKANEYGAKASGKAAELTAKIDAEKIRDSIVIGTQSVAEQATALYESLVTRGEKAFNEQPAPAAAQPATATASTTAAAGAEQKPAAENADVPAAKPAAKRQPRTK